MVKQACLCLFLLPSALCGQHVTVADSGTYYHVVCDLAGCPSRYHMGLELGQDIAAAAPDFELLVDSYLAERSGSNATYDLWLSRMEDIWPQVDQDFRDEIDGMTVGVGADTFNVRGDGKLSRDEIRLLNLFPDCARSSQCAGLTVFGAGSASGHAMTARLLDWNSGGQNQLGMIQAVTVIRNGPGSVCLVGHLGFMGAITGFNEDGLFAGILDSPTGTAYSSAGMRSYPMDIRRALETLSSVDQAAAYLSDTARHYAYNHLVLMSDMENGGVLENNFSGSGSGMRRGLRTDTSALNPGVDWGYPGMVAAVNSFVLLGNHDNHTGVPFNTGRWSSFRTQAGLCGGSLDWEELKQVASFDNGNGPGYEYTDIYNAGNHQVICFRPDSLLLEAAFKPRSGVLPADPIFQRVPVQFDSASGVAGLPDRTEPAVMLVYPNPSRGFVRIAVGEEGIGPWDVVIYDIAGKRAAEYRDLYTGGKLGLEINAGSLPRGVYFLRADSGFEVRTARLVMVK